MRKALFAQGSMLAVMMAVGISASAQQAERLKAEEMTAIRSAVSKAGPVSFWVVTEDFTGSFESIRANGEKVKADELKQNVGASMGSFQPHGILILLEDPTGKQQFRMSLGFTVPSRVKVGAPLKVEQIKYDKAVRYTHVGQYQQLANVYHGMNDVKGLKFPVVLRLVDDPTTVPAEWIRTELIAALK